MKKIFFVFLLSIFALVPIIAFANTGDGIGKIVYGVTGVISPVFDDIGPMGIMGIPHGAIRGALSIPGSNGCMILKGVGETVGGIIGIIPIVGPIIGQIPKFVVGDLAGGVLCFFGKTVGGFTSQMHPD